MKNMETIFFSKKDKNNKVKSRILIYMTNTLNLSLSFLHYIHTCTYVCMYLAHVC